MRSYCSVSVAYTISQASPTFENNVDSEYFEKWKVHTSYLYLAKYRKMEIGGGLNNDSVDTRTLVPREADGS